MSKTVIHWFRQDLRLKDNPSLAAAAKAGKVIPVYILDDESAGQYAMGGASRVWLHHSLAALDTSLNGKLKVFKGDAAKILPKLIKKSKAEAVYWNRCYEPWRIARDKEIKERLQSDGIEVESFKGSLLWEPWEALKKDGTPYKVFTPFYRNALANAVRPSKPLPKPKIHFADTSLKSETLDILPSLPWGKTTMQGWKAGEVAAHKRLEDFLDENIQTYKKGRDFPAQQSVSRLSPYLHFGEISPRQIYHAVKAHGKGVNEEHFIRELAWREFSYLLLYHFPQLPERNLQPKFNKFPWRKSKKDLEAWQKGQTGIPIVDAGMRELWQTGYMHNRIRMVVGSFLVKNLLLHWHEGERWFWDCLFDADLANNSASWQWIAGCGADAAPYFRVFNPVTQGQKFDAQGEYTKRFVPELKNMPDKYLFNPWDAPKDVLEAAGVELGKTYPKPVVDIKFSRERALEAYKKN